jgi:hypothetical protein
MVGQQSSPAKQAATSAVVHSFEASPSKESLFVIWASPFIVEILQHKPKSRRSSWCDVKLAHLQQMPTEDDIHINVQ